MRNIKLAMVALFAIFSFGAIAATSASAFPEFKGTKNTDFEALTVGTPTLRGERASAVGTITCEKILVKGTILVGTMLIDQLHIKFHGKCKQKVGSNEGTCAEPIEVKLVRGEIGFQNSTSKKVVIDLAPDSGTEFVTVTCANGNTKTEGEVIGEFPEINKAGVNQYNKSLSKFELAFKVSPAGTTKQEIQEILLLGGLMSSVHLKVSGFLGGEASEEATTINDLLPAGETGEITT
jgi:cytoskeletal protein CcmA (bactofilin family)